jgi:hypothetical protein
VAGVDLINHHLGAAPAKTPGGKDEAAPALTPFPMANIV